MNSDQRRKILETGQYFAQLDDVHKQSMLRYMDQFSAFEFHAGEFARWFSANIESPLKRVYNPSPGQIGAWCEYGARLEEEETKEQERQKKEVEERWHSENLTESRKSNRISYYALLASVIAIFGGFREELIVAFRYWLDIIK